jgi:hypothetical protein
MKLPLTLVCLALGLASVTRAEVCPNISNQELTVDARNGEWTPAAMKVTAGDLVLVFASGRAKVEHAMMRDLSPNGAPNGAGRLEMKVGTGTVVSTGERWVGAFREPGEIKFRVSSKGHNYQDFSGTYNVHLIVIPAGTLPPTMKVETE